MFLCKMLPEGTVFREGVSGGKEVFNLYVGYCFALQVPPLHFMSWKPSWRGVAKEKLGIGAVLSPIPLVCGFFPAASPLWWSLFQEVADPLRKQNVSVAQLLARQFPETCWFSF